MTKTIFTVMAAAMMLGGPICSVAFAADPVAVSYQAENKIPLANGVQFYLGDDHEYIQVSPIEGTSKVEFKGVKTTKEYKDASLFTVRALEKSKKGVYFELWVDGLQFVIQGADKKEYDLFTTGTDEYTDFKSLSVPDKSLNILESYTAYTVSQVLDEKDLNNNLASEGFALKYPTVKPQPEINPFEDQMIALSAETVENKLLGTSNLKGTDDVCFVLAIESGKKLLDADNLTKENLETAVFVVADPSHTFGIAGLDETKGLGYKFTRVEGKLLGKENSKTDGTVAFSNAIYNVEEKDQLNAVGVYDMGIKQFSFEGSKKPESVSIGGYALTATGEKSYITTLAQDEETIGLAQTTGNTWVKAADLLKAEDVAIYNIRGMGKKPSQEAPDAEVAASYYGKYFVANYGESDFIEGALAPVDVDLKSATAQWYVSSVSSRGVVEFKNLEAPGVSFTAFLHKTNEENVYKVGDSERPGAELIELIPSTGIDAFLSLTDKQLKQGVQLTLNGKGAITVDKIYMTKGEDLVDADKVVGAKLQAINNADKNLVWKFEKASKVAHEIHYAYLKDGDVMYNSKDTMAVETYYLSHNSFGLQKTDDGYQMKLAKDAISKSKEWSQYAFKKYVDGSWLMFSLDANGSEALEVAYDDVVKSDAQVLNVDISNAKFEDKAIKDANYSHVTLDFKDLNTSLAPISRRATFEAESGSLAYKKHESGVIEAIMADNAMTFWLDVIDEKAETPEFYIQRGEKKVEPETKAVEQVRFKNYLYYPIDSAKYYDANTASYKKNANYFLGEDTEGDIKAVFQPAAMMDVDTLLTVVNGNSVLVSKEEKVKKCVNGIENFRFQIVSSSDKGYVIIPCGAPNKFLYEVNGKLGFTDKEANALIVNVGEGDVTSNEVIKPEAASFKVVGNTGSITVSGATGKTVYVRNVLGMPLTNTILSSDNETILVPSGIVLVTVEDETLKVVVK